METDEKMDIWLTLHYESGQVPMLEIRNAFRAAGCDLTRAFNANDRADWAIVKSAYDARTMGTQAQSRWEAFRTACDRLGYRPARVALAAQEDTSEDKGEAPKRSEARERVVQAHRTQLQWAGLVPEAFVQAPQYHGDVGIDLASIGPVRAEPGMVTYVRTGVTFAAPPGYWILLLGRSSLAAKYGLACVPGVIDNGYRGEMLAGVYPIGYEPVDIPAGTRLVQAILVPAAPIHLVQVAELPPSDRGENGFGSTGH